MFEFHKDKQRYFEMQCRTSRKYIIPFVKPFLEYQNVLEILEIGCAEAGVLKAFLEDGHRCTGVELSASRAELARSFLNKEISEGKLEIINKNIFELEDNIYDQKFNLIILKDVIEHLPKQQEFIRDIKKFLAPGGRIFFGFPPWQMPFGGHQQICKSKFLANLPYFHLFPTSIYSGILKLFGERDKLINELIEIKSCGISIERFNRITKAEGFSADNKILFLINPIYQYKFKLAVRKQSKLISGIPYLRNYLTTAVYYLIKPV